MDSDLEALEAAAESLSAPLRSSTDFTHPAGFTEHLDNICRSASAASADEPREALALTLLSAHNNL